MSRSIHHTRRDLAAITKSEYSDPARCAEEAGKVKSQLALKRRIKAHVYFAEEKAVDAPPTPLDAIPIIVRDEEQCVHHAATPEDIRAMLARLPRGLCDRLESITLCLGREIQEERIDKAGPHEEHVADPYTGRFGFEKYKGIYCGIALGTYSPRTMRVFLYAYVYDDNAPHREVLEILLKCLALSTLAHEISHHNDWTMRMARGRWRMDDKTKGENYAEWLQEELVADCVVPYVKERYPQEVRALLDWLELHTGIALTLGNIMGEWRKSGEGTEFGEAINLNETIYAIGSQESKAEICHELSWALCRAGQCEKALAAVETAIAGLPGDKYVLRSKARILLKMNEPEAAAWLLREVVANHPEYKTAWVELGDCAKRLNDWAGVLEAADGGIRNCGGVEDYFLDFFRLMRVRAKLKLGTLEGLEEEILQLHDDEDPDYAARLMAELKRAREGRFGPA